MDEVTPQDGFTRVQEGALLVDVREQTEFEDVRAEGATLLPLSEFEDRYAELPQNRPLVMICRSGARSGRAAEFLLRNGYTDVVNLKGGTLAWVEDGLPTLRGP